MRKFASRRGDAARVIRRVTIWNFYGVSAFNQKQKKKKGKEKTGRKKVYRWSADKFKNTLNFLRLS